MDDWKHLTAQNASAWRDEIFAAWVANGTPADAERVRFWIREAVNPESQITQLYRMLELDLEADILRSLPAFEGDAYIGRLERHYSLRMLWRVLFRRHAISAARRVGQELQKTETRVWRWWRRKDYLFARLGVGVLLGFFSLGASSGVLGIFDRARFLGWWWMIPGFSLVLIFGMALAEVQRRVGRIAFRLILGRAVRIVCWGALYSALGAVIQWWGAGEIGCRDGYFWRTAVMCGAAALLLGFVFQLFWQDRSIGEPL